LVKSKRCLWNPYREADFGDKTPRFTPHLFIDTFQLSVALLARLILSSRTAKCYFLLKLLQSWTQWLWW
jgi:hypothetical protein